LGDRSKNPKKYIDDAELLKIAYEKERLCGEKIIYCRYAFYCAQSYKDAGKEYYDESIAWYKKCFELENGYQEKYVSAINIAGMYLLKNDINNALTYFYKTAEFDLERIDGIAAAMKILYDKKEYIVVNSLYHRFKNYTLITKDKLFVNPGPYLNCVIEFYGAMSSHYIRDNNAAYECCKKMISVLDVKSDRLAQAFIILSKYKLELIKDSAVKKEMFLKLDALILQNFNKNKKLDPHFTEVWKILFEKVSGCKSSLVNHIISQPVV
jgi:tetratricopeptide (TPR) repeat protein